MDIKSNFNQKYYASEYDDGCNKEEELIEHFRGIATKIISSLHPQIVLDVGCEYGYLVESLRELGVEAWGIDISSYAIRQATESIKPFVYAQSATEPLPEMFPQKFDLIVSIDMLEHVNEDIAMTILDNLSPYTDNFLISTSCSNFDDLTHFNVQPPAYWVEKFARRGFFEDVLYDGGFLAPQTIMVKRCPEMEQSRIAYEYKRAWWHTVKEMQNLREQFHKEDETKKELKEAWIGRLQKEYFDLQDALVQSENRIQEYISANEHLHREIDKWYSAYNGVINASFWKITKPLRILSDINKVMLRNAKKHTMRFLVSLRGGDENLGQYTQVNLQQAPQWDDVNNKQIKTFLNQSLRETQAIQTVLDKSGPHRLNVVTDSLENHSLLGGVATALIVATEFAKKNNLELRIITRMSPPNPHNYQKIMQMSNIVPVDKVSFYSDSERDIDGNISYKLDISERDIFCATSWWSAAAIKKTTLRNRFFYILQEVETFFYPHGDQHYLCSQVMSDQNIDYIINSHYLFEYFREHEPNVVKHGVYFEPAFPSTIYGVGSLELKKKYKLFFYARPNNPRNMFLYGLHMLDLAVNTGILDLSEWEIYCAGQDIPVTNFSNGHCIHNLGRMDWIKYGEFLKEVDLSLSLMYTPHPSYPPFDVASSGGVVLSNKCDNKQAFDWCKNVILSELEEEQFLKSFELAIRLAKDIPQRKKNFIESTISRDWNVNLKDTLEVMRGMLKHD